MTYLIEVYRKDSRQHRLRQRTLLLKLQLDSKKHIIADYELEIGERIVEVIQEDIRDEAAARALPTIREMSGLIGEGE